MRSLALAALLAGPLSFSALGQCDGQWLAPATGTAGPVGATARYMGVLAAAGRLTPEASVDSVALWNGVEWHTLGTSDGEVFVLMQFGNDLVAGGDFTAINGVSASNIARWDGTSWSPLGAGMSAAARSLATYQHWLIAGGNFGMADGVSVEGLARWDGVGWHSMWLDDYGVVYCVTVLDDRLLIGTGGQLFTGGHVLEWDGDGWREVGGAFFDGDHLDFGYVLAIGAVDDQLVAGGFFYHLESPGGELADCLARWNGVTWEAFPNQAWEWDIVWQLHLYNGSLVAAGEGARNIARWDGMAWLGFGDGADNSVFALTVHEGELVTGGRFSRVDGESSPHIARWTDSGAPWIAVQPGSPGRVCAGSSVELGLTVASGYDPVQYLWRRDGTPLQDGPSGTGATVSGSTTDTLLIVNVRRGDSGIYDCIISNMCGSDMSTPATVGVCAADFDCDGFVTGLDFDGFVAAFEEGNASADFDQDGFVTGLDVDSFVDAFEIGC